MPAAALTPRVQIMVVCDEIVASETESDVFTLEGVRQQARTEKLPCVYRPQVFLLLSSARKGVYHGEVLIVQERNDRAIRYGKSEAEFREDHDRVRADIDLGTCMFPQHGAYVFQVWFASRSGGMVLKAEQRFDIILEGE